jgi:hypothetical protein
VAPDQGNPGHRRSSQKPNNDRGKGAAVTPAGSSRMGRAAFLAKKPPCEPAERLPDGPAGCDRRPATGRTKWGHRSGLLDAKLALE